MALGKMLSVGSGTNSCGSNRYDSAVCGVVAGVVEDHSRVQHPAFFVVFSGEAWYNWIRIGPDRAGKDPGLVVYPACRGLARQVNSAGYKCVLVRMIERKAVWLCKKEPHGFFVFEGCRNSGLCQGRKKKTARERGW
jgi:hypothetical protein